MARLAIIPARGGSKRILKKNIKDFLGKPIISYSIEVALSSGLFDEVMVSTENEEIAKISKAFGTKVGGYITFQNMHCRHVAVWVKWVRINIKKSN